MNTESQNDNRELWHTIFAVGHPALRSFQNFHRHLPSPPRCKLCFAPFKGVGSWLMSIKGKAPSSRNPRYCSACDKFLRAYPGGAEVEISMLFVDVRGSSALAEKMSPTEFSRVMNSFYAVATRILNEFDGFIIDLVGDEVVALFPPGFSGPNHARKAVLAAQRLLHAEVPLPSAGKKVEWGVGVNTGIVYVGTVTGAQAGIEDVRALGDQVNATARLASLAPAGEAFLAEQTCRDSGLNLENLPQHQVEMKGRETPFALRVMRHDAAPAEKPAVVAASI